MHSNISRYLNNGFYCAINVRATLNLRALTEAKANNSFIFRICLLSGKSQTDDSDYDDGDCGGGGGGDGGSNKRRQCR